jgi:hypothetical protein
MSQAVKPTPTQGKTATVPVPHEKVAQRAYEKWLQRGQPQGTEEQDWLEAEAEVRAELAQGSSPQPRR